MIDSSLVQPSLWIMHALGHPDKLRHLTPAKLVHFLSQAHKHQRHLALALLHPGVSYAFTSTHGPSFQTLRGFFESCADM